MRHLEQELATLRLELSEMWRLVISQVNKCGEAILTFDKDLAMQVSMREKRVDSYELKLDSICENIIALHQPVAIDLRFVLAALKINSNLERIGDFAHSISRTIISHPSISLDADMIQQTNLRLMIEEVKKMLTLGLDAFESENSSIASAIFSEDYKVDEINKNAPHIMAKYIEANPDRAFDCLQLIGVFRKLERLGDHCSNIAEELFFYLDAKVLKHAPKG